MEMVNITDWASSEIKTLEITHDLGNIRFPLRVRQFVPVEGDQLAQKWADGEVLKHHSIPPYAIANMEEAAQALLKYVDSGVAPFLVGALGHSESFYWDTYLMAFKYSQEAPTNTEKMLLVSVLRLWVMAQIGSSPERVCGEENLGSVVEDPSSPYHGKMLIPQVLIAQFEIISAVALQRLLAKTVLNCLHMLIKANKKCYWFTIYLALFILLHSCSITTRRDGEFARQMLIGKPFANPQCIAEHHVGVLTMLAHFHYCNKGSHPLAMAGDPKRLQELVDSTGLGAEQARFLKDTSRWVNQKKQRIRLVRDQKDLEDDLYFISQLFEEN